MRIFNLRIVCICKYSEKPLKNLFQQINQIISDIINLKILLRFFESARTNFYFILDICFSFRIMELFKQYLTINLLTGIKLLSGKY